MTREMTNEARVEQVLAWLELPAAEQPSIHHLYFSDTDKAGHAYGPESQGVERAVALSTDARRLSTACVGAAHGPRERRGHVRSRHGRHQPGPRHCTSTTTSMSTVNVTSRHQISGSCRHRFGDAVYAALKGASALRVYRREQTPDHWHYRDNPRIPPIVGVADDGWGVAARGMAAAAGATGRRAARMVTIRASVDAWPVRRRRSRVSPRRERAAVRERPHLQFSLCAARVETVAQRRRSKCDQRVSSLIRHPKSGEERKPVG